MSEDDREPRLGDVPFTEALVVWVRVALLSFGGPAGQIAVMRRLLVDEKRWLSEERFLHALNYCMLLPGPEAQQLATYGGWLLHRTRGGLIAGTLFVLPGFLSILVLSVLYVEWGASPVVAGLFFGLKPAVLAIVLQAFVRLSRAMLTSQARRLIALSAFLALFVFHVPFPWIVVVAALLGWWGGREAVEGLRSQDQNAATSSKRPPLGRSFRVLALGLAVWWAPILALGAILGTSSIYAREAVFFSQTAMVTFGGAYAVLSYIAQRAVEDFGWLAPGEMLDGLGLAETTPGPLVQVVQFVGFLGAYRNPGALDPIWAGVLGSIVVTWATFAPCFLWIFLGAPYVEWLRGRRGLADALAGVSSAVVGVLVHLALWFAHHTLFADVARWTVLEIEVPVLASIRPVAVVLALACALCLFRLRWGVPATLLLGALGGTFWQLLAA
ncbi:MAG: chromate efflux transporter [Acidobacteriota bacterium]